MSATLKYAKNSLVCENSAQLVFFFISYCIYIEFLECRSYTFHSNIPQRIDE